MALTQYAKQKEKKVQSIAGIQTKVRKQLQVEEKDRTVHYIMNVMNHLSPVLVMCPVQAHPTFAGRRRYEREEENLHLDRNHEH